MANEFSYQDLMNNHFPEGVFPQKYDFVTNVQSGEEFFINHINNDGTYALKTIGNPLNNQTDTYYSKTDLPALTHKPTAFVDQTKTFNINTISGALVLGREIYFDDSIITGINTKYYRLFKNEVTDSAISVDPTTSNRDIRDYVPAVTVNRADGVFKAPTPMLVNQKLLIGDRVTLIAYDNENNPISIMPINIGYTFCRDRGSDGIVGIQIVSPFNSASDASLIDIRNRDKVPEMSDFVIKVIYTDGDFKILNIDNNIVKVYGLEDFLVDTTTANTIIRAVYNYTPADGISRFFIHSYHIVKDQSDLPEYVPPPVIERAWTTGGYDSISAWLAPTYTYTYADSYTYPTPWTNALFAANTSVNSWYSLFPWGGWEEGLRPTIIRIKFQGWRSNVNTPHWVLSELNFFNKGGTLIPSLRTIVSNSPDLLPDEYYVYYYISRWPKSKYPNDVRDDLGVISFVRTQYFSFRCQVRNITLLSESEDPLLADSKSLGRLSSALLYCESSQYNNDYTTSEKVIKDNLLDRITFLRTDRLYTSARVPNDNPLSIPDKFYSNSGIEAPIRGSVNMGYVLYGNPGSQAETVFRYSNQPDAGTLYAVPRDTHFELSSVDFSNISFVASVKIGRMPRQGGSFTQDTPGPNWYVGIGNWMKFTIGNNNTAHFIDTASGVSESFPVTRYTNPTDPYYSVSYSYYYNSANLSWYSSAEERGYAAMYMNEVIFAYNKTSGKAVLIHDGVVIKTWANYPANFPSGDNRMVYNCGTYSGVASVGQISLYQSSYLSSMLIANGMMYREYIDNIKTTLFTYGGWAVVRSENAPYNSWPYKENPTPDLTNSLPYIRLEDAFDHWKAFYYAGKIGVPLTCINDSINNVFEKREVGSIYASPDATRVRHQELFQTKFSPGINMAAGFWPSFYNGGTGHTGWADLSKFTQAQIDGAQAFMNSIDWSLFNGYIKPPYSGPYPTTLLTNYSNL